MSWCLMTEGLQWMLFRSAMSVDAPGRGKVVARSMRCTPWLNAYDTAPKRVQTRVRRCLVTNAWAPAIQRELDFGGALAAVRPPLPTPLHAVVSATAQRHAVPDVPRLLGLLQRTGVFCTVERLAMALELSAFESPRAFEVLIADPNADAALPGPTRCSAGDAYNPPRHHSVRCDGERVTVHDVLLAAINTTAAWRAFCNAELPFAARVMNEEWAYECTGPCGCVGTPRCFGNPLHEAIERGNDEAGAWLAARLPPTRLNALSTGRTPPPLLRVLQTDTPMPRTLTALLVRGFDVNLTVRGRVGDGEYTAAQFVTSRPPQWLEPQLVAAVQLQTRRFGAQYPPSAAVLCVQSLQSLHSAVSVPRELVRLVLQYTALPQPNLWPNAHDVAAADAAAVASAAAGVAFAAALAPAPTPASAAASTAASASQASEEVKQPPVAGRKRRRRTPSTDAAVVVGAVTTAAAADDNPELVCRRSARLRQKRA